MRTLLAGFSLACSLIAAAAAQRPNIVFIMSDDHAAHAISAYGSRVNKTPQIDRLAREGMRLENCFCTNSICTPSRATIITGKYSHLNGVPVFNRSDGRQPTLAKHLQAAGYHTGMIGKWHLGSDPTGFDYWNILPGQGVYHNPVFIEMGKRRKHQGYVTDLIGEFSLEFLKRRPADKPFFLMCHHKAPHRNWQPSPKYLDKYKDVTVPEPETLFDDYSGRELPARDQQMTVANHLNDLDLKLVKQPGLTPESPSRRPLHQPRIEDATFTDIPEP